MRDVTAANSIQQLLEEVESLKSILVVKATGEGTDETEYHRLRQRLTTNALVKDMLPRFVRTCRTLGEFWPFIREQDGTYAGRRRYLADQFEKVLAFLEQQAATPGDEPINQMMKWQRMPGKEVGLEGMRLKIILLLVKLWAKILFLMKMLILQK